MKVLPPLAVVTCFAVLVACVGDASNQPFPDGFPGDAGPTVTPSRPDLGPTTVASVRPPPIYGGTLLATADGKWSIAADPDRDQIFVVDLNARKLHATIDTGPGSQPFRSIESAPGIVSVTLRGTGRVVTIDAVSGTALWTAPACVEARGIAFDPATQTVAVACERGEIVSLEIGTGSFVHSIAVDATSLRDVFIEGDGFWVSDFRSARVLHVDGTGAILKTLDTATNLPFTMAGGVAWRTRRIGKETFVVVHQDSTGATLETSTKGGYGGTGCDGGVVPSTVSVVDGSTTVDAHVIGAAPLPVDVAYAAGSDRMLVALAGNSWTSNLPKFAIMSRAAKGPGPCSPMAPTPVEGEIVATEIGPSNIGLLQSREPALLHFVDLSLGEVIATVSLSPTSRRDTGHILFHANSGRGIACASCHPEGGDDGRVWIFTADGTGKRRRRTPSLRGTILGTAPYHWDGEEPTLDALFDEVMIKRMDGPFLDSAQRGAFASFLQQIPAPGRPASGSDPAIARGDALFHGDGKCITCHGDSNKPSTGLFDVGTGGDFGAPSLNGVSLRAPFMHDGCASTLEQRFVAPCGGTDHGPASLTDENKSDLIRYLKTL